jgi:hypothetical protein
MDIKESFQIKLNELRGKSSLSDDERKELKDRIRKKHGKAWNDTIDIRKEKKSAGPADTKDMDKFRNRLAKMYNKLEEANSKNTIKIKRKYYTDKAKEMETERNDRFSSSNPVRRAMMTQVHGSVGSPKAKKSARKLKRIKQAADVAGKMLKKDK